MYITSVASLLSLIWSLVNSQTVFFVSFNGVNLPNHGYVDLSEVGRPEDGGDSVECHTDLQTCCASAQGIHRGDWYFPDGIRLPFSSATTAPIYQQRTAQRVDIRHRGTANSPSGIYRCYIATIAVHDDDIRVRDTIYVGIYGSGGIL